MNEMMHFGNIKTNLSIKFNRGLGKQLLNAVDDTLLYTCEEK